jgi:acyl carrier protein
MSLEKILSDVYAFPQDTIADSLPLRQIPRWDSLAHMMLIVKLEETYNIQFSGDEIADMRSVGDLRSTLHKHGVEI